jgi:Ca-activated chloride channel homolog
MQSKKAAPGRDDAMIIFDASGSMSGNQTLDIPNSHAPIDEARYVLVCSR